MPLNPNLVEALVRSGLSAVCATCSKYWEGRERGLPEPRCTSVKGCGSPMAGDDFSEYDGPLRELDQWCFVCARPSRYGVRIKNRARVIGVCEAHAKLLSSLKPEQVPAGETTLVGADGRPVPTVVPKKTLLQAIAESEAGFEKDGK